VNPVHTTLPLKVRTVAEAGFLAEGPNLASALPFAVGVRKRRAPASLMSEWFRWWRRQRPRVASFLPQRLIVT